MSEPRSFGQFLYKQEPDTPIKEPVSKEFQVQYWTQHRAWLEEQLTQAEAAVKALREEVVIAEARLAELAKEESK